MFIAETILSAVAILFPNSFLNLVKEAFSNEPIIKYRDDSNLQNIIDLVQTEFQCCGVSDKGYKDWSKNIYFECLDTNPSRERCAVPYSCCRNSRNLDVSFSLRSVSFPHLTLSFFSFCLPISSLV